MHEMQTIVTDVRGVCLSVRPLVCHAANLGFTVQKWQNRSRYSKDPPVISPVEISLPLLPVIAPLVYNYRQQPVIAGLYLCCHQLRLCAAAGWNPVGTR